jgi:hypothetical protein
MAELQQRNNGLQRTPMFSDIDKEILQQIRDIDTKNLLTGKDKNGIPFLKHIFRLHKTIFGETCSSCPNKISGYIQKIKNFNFDKMEIVKKNSTNKFTLAEGTLLVFAGTSRAYSKHNITDEVALEYLVKNPNRVSLFSKVPDDIQKLIEDYKKSDLKGGPEKLTEQTNSITVVDAERVLNKDLTEKKETETAKAAEDEKMKSEAEVKAAEDEKMKNIVKK